MERRIEDYVYRGMHSVRGYLSLDDATLFYELMKAQTDAGITGGAAEIGVYFGRSFFLMQQMLTPSERCFAADLFDQDIRPEGPSGQMLEFLDNARKLGLTVDAADIYAGDTAHLTAKAVTDRTGPVRFFSVDGGHELHHLKQDSAIALEALHERGIICFDDFMNPEWPEVSLGVFDFLREHAGKVSPFCLSEKKAYVCLADQKAFYTEVMETAPGLARHRRSPTSILGEEVCRYQMPPQTKVLTKLLERIGAPSVGKSVY